MGNALRADFSRLAGLSWLILFDEHAGRRSDRGWRFRPGDAAGRSVPEWTRPVPIALRRSDSPKRAMSIRFAATYPRRRGPTCQLARIDLDTTLRASVAGNRSRQPMRTRH